MSGVIGDELADVGAAGDHDLGAEQLEAAKGETAVIKLQMERATAILENSSRYQIPADLSGAIYDIALSEGIDPSLGYQLVKIESQFNRKAKSPMQAFGYTQLQLATAKFYQPGISQKDLYERDTNLRLGFRFLNDLLARFDYDVHLALLAYNRGPARVDQILARGGNPANGYSDAVLKGFRPIAAPKAPPQRPLGFRGLSPIAAPKALSTNSAAR